MDILTDLRATLREVRIVVVTMHVDPVLVDAAVGLGAAGFVPKDAGIEELKTAINEARVAARHYARRSLADTNAPQGAMSDA